MASLRYPTPSRSPTSRSIWAPRLAQIGHVVDGQHHGRGSTCRCFKALRHERRRKRAGRRCAIVFSCWCAGGWKLGASSVLGMFFIYETFCDSRGETWRSGWLGKGRCYSTEHVKGRGILATAEDTGYVASGTEGELICGRLSPGISMKSRIRLFFENRSCVSRLSSILPRSAHSLQHDNGFAGRATAGEVEMRSAKVAQLSTCGPLDSGRLVRPLLTLVGSGSII